MKAVIVAAGAGSRLQDVAGVKPLARVGGRCLLEHALRNCAAAGAESAVIVTGHGAAEIAAFAAAAAPLPLPVELVFNADWRAGNGSSLLAAGRVVTGDCVLTMCDHLFDPSIMADLIRLRRDEGCKLVLAVDRRMNSELIDLGDVTKVLAPDGRIAAIGKGIADYDGFDTGLFRLSPEVFAMLAELRRSRSELGISDAVRHFASRRQAGVMDIGHRFWIDVDDARMLDLAERHLRHHAAACPG